MNQCFKYVTECNDRSLYPPVQSTFQRESPYLFLFEMFLLSLLSLLITWIIVSRRNKKTNNEGCKIAENFIIFYFSVSLIHAVFDGYYLRNFEKILSHGDTGITASIFGDVWRFVGTYDTRWLGPQSGTVRSQYSGIYAIETVATWGVGIGALLTLVAYYSNRHARFIFQVITITLQANAVVINIISAWFENFQSIPMCNKYLWIPYFTYQIVPTLLFCIIVFYNSFVKSAEKGTEATSKGKETEGWTVGVIPAIFVAVLIFAIIFNDKWVSPISKVFEKGRLFTPPQPDLSAAPDSSTPPPPPPPVKADDPPPPLDDIPPPPPSVDDIPPPPPSVDDIPPSPPSNRDDVL